MFSIITPLDTNRLEQFKNTKRAYDAMLQQKEFLIPTRSYDEVLNYLNEHGLMKDVKLFPYTIETGFNVSKALNMATRNASFPSIIITSPEILPITPVLEQLETLIGQNVVCQVWDENERGKRVRTLVRTGKRSESPRMYFLAMFNKADIEKINGWDEDFLKGYAYEDDDFGARWNRAGLPFIVRDDIQARHQYHPRGETIPGGLEINRRKIMANNAAGITKPKNGLVKLDEPEAKPRKMLLINDTMSPLGEQTFWHKLQEWFDLEFVGGDYETLATTADPTAHGAPLIIRSGSYFPHLAASEQVLTIAIIHEILYRRKRSMQDDVINRSAKTVVDSQFVKNHYSEHPNMVVIPSSTDFDLFQPIDNENLRQDLGIADDSVCWIGASQGLEGDIKNFALFLDIVGKTPDINYVAVFKDADIDDKPPNLKTFVLQPQTELVKIINSCRVGLCTSKLETLHLAGIEMGGCGLPMVAPPVGTYWQRKDMPGAIVNEGDDWVPAIKQVLAQDYDTKQVRDYWYREFNEETVRDQWSKLIEEVIQSVS